MPKTIMCLSCGKNFKSEEEGMRHAEESRRLEEETRWHLSGKTSWVNGEISGADPSKYKPAHIVQISQSLGVA